MLGLAEVPLDGSRPKAYSSKWVIQSSSGSPVGVLAGFTKPDQSKPRIHWANPISGVALA